MKFSELEYQRPDLDLLKEDFFNQISLIEKAEEAEVALKATKHIQEIQNTLGTLSTLVSIRNSIIASTKKKQPSGMSTSQLLVNGIRLTIELS